MEPAERAAIVEGIAALTVTLAEMGLSEVEAQQQLMARLNQLEAFDAQLLMDAAAAIDTSAVPSGGTLAESEQNGVTSPRSDVHAAQDELISAVRGREWLQRLAGCVPQ